MSFQEDVHSIFLHVLNDCGGNKAEAARKLGVSPVTFWLWVTRERQPIKEAISRAIDLSGARLVSPFQPVQETQTVHSTMLNGESGEYRTRIATLEDALAKSELERLSLVGEIKALERQLARLAPAPPAPVQHAGGDIELVPPKALDEKEPPYSDLKTVNG